MNKRAEKHTPGKSVRDPLVSLLLGAVAALFLPQIAQAQSCSFDPIDYQDGDFCSAEPRYIVVGNASTPMTQLEAAAACDALGSNLATIHYDDPYWDATYANTVDWQYFSMLQACIDANGFDTSDTTADWKNCWMGLQYHVCASALPDGFYYVESPVDNLNFSLYVEPPFPAFSDYHWPNEFDESNSDKPCVELALKDCLDGSVVSGCNTILFTPGFGILINAVCEQQGVHYAICDNPEYFATCNFKLRPANAAGSAWEWNPMQGAVSYDVIRGSLASVFDSGSIVNLGQVLCIEDDSLDTATLTGGLSDNVLPNTGEVFFYLARLFDGSANSSYGSSAATGNERIPAGADCP